MVELTGSSITFGLLNLFLVFTIVNGLPRIQNLSSESLNLIGNGSSTTNTISGFESELVTAVVSNDPQTIERLAEEGADIKKNTSEGGSLLHLAAKHGSVEAAGKLLDLGLEIDRLDLEDKTPLWIATSKGNVNMMEALFGRGADLNLKGGGWWGRSLVHEAALGGQDAALTWLLDKGLQVDVQDSSGQTPLHLAAGAGHLSTVRLLLERNASSTVADKDGEVPLHESARRGHLDVVELLANSTDVNAPNKAGVTPLLAAAGKGRKEVVRYLLDRGALINTKTRDGWTALHEAATGGYVDTAILLLDRGALVDSKDKDGWTPLFSAAAIGNTLLVQILTDRGADIRQAANNGDTPLHEAASRGHFDTVKELIQRRADVNARTADGKTPLRVAYIWGYNAVVDLLRSKGGVM